MRGSYCSPSYDSSCDFDAELVETVITKIKRGKAAGPDDITVQSVQSPIGVVCVIETVQWYG